MKGLQIFIHSVRQVFGNLGAALRISGVLTLVQFALFFVFGLQVLFSADGGRAMMMAGEFPWLRLAIFVLLYFISTMWIAVAWHRYVLREEGGQSALPSWHGDRIWAYFVASLLMGLVLFVVSFVVSFLAAFVFGFMAARDAQESSPVAFLIGAFLVGGPIIYVTYRLCPVLPAAALGVPLKLREAWAKMAGTGGTILVLAVTTVLASIALDQVPNLLFGSSRILSMIWSLIAQWVGMMVGISIVTTLYGHYVEGRSLV